jgi:hypothetical protein
MGSADWLPLLTGNPEMSPRGLAVAIAQAIFDTAQGISDDKPVHSAMIDLPKISQVMTDISKLARDLIDSTGSSWNEVWDAWSVAHSYSFLDSAFIHLRKFASEIKDTPGLNATVRNDAQALVASIKAAVPLEYVHSYRYGPPMGGISTYLPWSHDDFDSTSYVQLDFSETDWYSFISTFIQSFSEGYAGALNILSYPPGARVFLNGEDTGYETNVVVGDLIPGFYEIRLVKSGYQDWIRPPVEVYARQTKRIQAVLEPEP